MNRKIIKKFKSPIMLCNGDTIPKTNCSTNSNIPDNMDEVLTKIKTVLGESNDITYRELQTNNGTHISSLLVFIDGLIDKQLLNSDIIRPLLEAGHAYLEGEIFFNNVRSRINSCIMAETDSFDDVIDAILSGEAVLFFDNENRAIMFGLTKPDKRSVEEPPNDSVVRGPREGFTEALRTNTSLIRRKIKNGNLRFESIKIGRQTKTQICICYIKGIVHDNLVDEVKKRLNKINTDAILESGYIEEFIEDRTFSIFPTVGNSEKPDIVAAKLLEGRIAIFCDGTPFVLTVPYLFIEAIQSSEDYYSRSIYSIFSRFLRILAILLTSMLPAYYVALVTFHQDVIPFKLLLTMYASREGIPFPALVEALIMVITFELLREAGVRMPRPIGQAVSIVGALVIGDAAVKAGIVSTPMVIIIATTAITSFIITPLSNALLIIRILTMLAANIIGILGIVLVSVAIFIYLCSLRSFGVNYLSPVTPLSGMDLKDTFIRYPLWSMLTRPKSLAWGKNGISKYRTKRTRGGKLK